MKPIILLELFSSRTLNASCSRWFLHRTLGLSGVCECLLHCWLSQLEIAVYISVESLKLYNLYSCPKFWRFYLIIKCIRNKNRTLPTDWGMPDFSGINKHSAQEPSVFWITMQRVADANRHFGSIDGSFAFDALCGVCVLFRRPRLVGMSNDSYSVGFADFVARFVTSEAVRQIRPSASFCPCW